MSNITFSKINTTEKIIKYILMGLIVILLTIYIPNCALTNYEILIISDLSAIAFAILDMVSHAVKIKVNKNNGAVNNPFVVVIP